MARVINPNLIQLRKAYKEDKRGIALEGASRSGKTISIIQFLILGSVRRYWENANIIITRETYASFNTTLANDFNRFLPMFGLKSPFVDSQRVTQFKIFGNTFHLIGADNPNKFEGAGSDIFWMNETLDQPNDVFDQLEQRCRKFFILDYNPKVSDHWVYNKVCNRPDVVHFKSTFRDNKFISDPELKKILSYEPTPENIKAGTADDYRWNVYGLGNRMAQEGLIFRDVTWIDEFPTDVDRVWYGQDYGFTNSPSALVKVAIKGRNVFWQYMIYEPTEKLSDLIALYEALEISKDDLIYADAAEPGMISDTRNEYGYECYPAKKFPGSIKYGLDLIKRYKLHVVRNPNARKEFENYAYKSINGIQTNEPIDDFNHGIDAGRYACQHELRDI